MEISGDNPDRILYKQEFQKGVQLFEAGFKGLQKSQLDAQKQEYEKSMGESLEVIQDTANALMNQHLMKMKDQLAKDYQNYLANPSDGNRDKIQKDINSLQREIKHLG